LLTNGKTYTDIGQLFCKVVYWAVSLVYRVKMAKQITIFSPPRSHLIPVFSTY